MNESINIYKPMISFSTFNDVLTIVLDNTNNDYDSFIPNGFKITNKINEIDFNNGIKVSRRHKIDGHGVEHLLYEFTIERNDNNPKLINYV